MSSLRTEDTRYIMYDETRNVLQASKERIEHIWNNNDRVYVSYSGGKDSICLANVILEVGMAGKIDLKKTHWLFVDEEAIYPCVERVVRNFRLKVMSMGMKFYWYCLPFKHFSCLEELKQDESFICWDPRKKDKWIREMPDFAIKSHPEFRVGDSYQKFFNRILKNSPSVIGLRANESIQRRKSISALMDQKGTSANGKLYPIHDWTDRDVWKYIKDRNLDFPDAYLYMYKTGATRKDMRISQFFSIDTAKSLVKMVEFYPNLYEKIINREENAYLAMMYWDTAMFGRTTHKRKQLENTNYDYEKLVMEGLDKLKEDDPTTYRDFIRLKNKYGFAFTKATWKKMHTIMVAGDPKGRTFRSMYATLKY